MAITPFSTIAAGKFLAICLLALVFSAQPAASQTSKAIISEDRTRLKLGSNVLLNSQHDGFLSIRKVSYSPDEKRFAVIACGFECNDNTGFLFNADGSGKRKFTARWDNILQDKVEWSADGKRLFYYRVNSTAAKPPANAPGSGWIEIDVVTGRKAAAISRVLKPKANYTVFNLRSGDLLSVRESPSSRSKIIGKLAHDATGVRYTGEQGKGGWAKVIHDGLTGWVNQNFLYETPKEQELK